MRRPRALLAAVMAAAAVAIPATALSVRSDIRGYCGHPSPLPSPPAEADNLKLEQLQVFIRHGDRTRWSSGPCWKGDNAVFDCSLSQLQQSSSSSNPTLSFGRIYREIFMRGREPIPGNCTTGQLTSKGHVQELQNGQHLRAAYGDFLEGLLESGEYMLRSDVSQRTIMSGQALFDGMMPPKSDKSSRLRGGTTAQDSFPAVDWYTITKGYDSISPTPTLCPAITTLMNNATTQPEYVKHAESITLPLEKELSQALGIPLSAVNLDQVFDCFYTHLCHDYALPSSINGDLLSAVVDDNTWNEQYIYEFPGAGKLFVGLLVRDALEAIDTVVKGGETADVKTRRFALYSGHDTGPMMPLLAAFGVFDGVWTPYASMIVWELWSDATKNRSELSTTDYSLRFIYNGKVLSVPGCSSDLCPLDEFETLARALIPTDEECSLDVEADREVTNRQFETSSFTSFVRRAYFDPRSDRMRMRTIRTDKD